MDIKTIPSGLLFCLFLSAFTQTELLTSDQDSLVQTDVKFSDKTNGLNKDHSVNSASGALVWGNIQVIKDHSGINIIQWSTLEESNTREFLIQHSEDGYHFKAFKRIVAQGVTSKPFHYQAEDTKGRGDLYYRIIGIDNEGKAFYSKVAGF